MSKSIKSIKII